MKKILIPTNFSVDSLQLVEHAILNNPRCKLNIILIAGHTLPNNRWTITHFNKSEEVRKQYSDGFLAAERSLMREYKESIDTLTFELFTGHNSIAFRHFLKQLDADTTVIPKTKLLQGKSKKWFDTTAFLKQQVPHVIEVPIRQQVATSPPKSFLRNLLNL